MRRVRSDEIVRGMLTGSPSPGLVPLCQGPGGDAKLTRRGRVTGRARARHSSTSTSYHAQVGAAAADDGPAAARCRTGEPVGLDHVPRRGVVDRGAGRHAAYAEVLEGVAQHLGHGPGHRHRGRGRRGGPSTRSRTRPRARVEEADRPEDEVVGGVDDRPGDARVRSPGSRAGAPARPAPRPRRTDRASRPARSGCAGRSRPRRCGARRTRATAAAGARPRRAPVRRATGPAASARRSASRVPTQASRSSPRWGRADRIVPSRRNPSRQASLREAQLPWLARQMITSAPRSAKPQSTSSRTARSIAPLPRTQGCEPKATSQRPSALVAQLDGAGEPAVDLDREPTRRAVRPASRHRLGDERCGRPRSSRARAPASTAG